MKPDQKPELVFIMLTSVTSVLTRGGVGWGGGGGRGDRPVLTLKIRCLGAGGGL